MKHSEDHRHETEDDKTHGEAITLKEFLGRVPNTIDQFVEATMRRYREGDQTMNPNDPRPESWWWREVGAFLCVVNDDDHEESEERVGEDAD